MLESGRCQWNCFRPRGATTIHHDAKRPWDENYNYDMALLASDYFKNAMGPAYTRLSATDLVGVNRDIVDFLDGEIRRSAGGVCAQYGDAIPILNCGGQDGYNVVNNEARMIGKTIAYEWKKKV